MNDPFERPYSYQLGQFLSRSFFRLLGTQVEGLENLPTSGRTMIVSNHQSFLDPLIVSLSCPHRQIHFMAKEELFSIPTARHLLLSLGAFPVDRKGPGKQTIAKVLTLLREERLICLFAEGTRSRDGALQPFQPGFAKIARKTKTPVIPIAISGTRNLFESIQGPSLPLWNRIVGQAPPSLKIGAAIPPELSAQEIVERTHQAVQTLLEE